MPMNTLSSACPCICSYIRAGNSNITHRVECDMIIGHKMASAMLGRGGLGINLIVGRFGNGYSSWSARGHPPFTTSKNISAVQDNP